MFPGDYYTASFFPRSFFPKLSAAPGASFVRLDTTTQGNWKGVYGMDGYAVAADAGAGNPSVPPYASGESVRAQPPYAWAPWTADPRGLQKSAPGSTDRLAACWYDYGEVDVRLPLSDGGPHQVAIYLLDWDSNARIQTVDVVNSATGAVLDTRTVANFQGGVYLVWTLTGDVTIRIRPNSASNVVLSAVFFGGMTTPVTSATFVKTDTSTQGNWKGAYGSDGFILALDPGAGNPALPAYARQAAVRSPATHLWAGSTADPRGYLVSAPGSSDRMAGCWYAYDELGVDVAMTDGRAHRLSVYALDWDNNGRSQVFEVVNATTGSVLDSRTAGGFQNGSYLVWQVQGNVTVRVRPNSAANIVVSAVFFDPSV